MWSEVKLERAEERKEEVIGIHINLFDLFASFSEQGEIKEWISAALFWFALSRARQQCASSKGVQQKFIHRNCLRTKDPRDIVSGVVLALKVFGLKVKVVVSILRSIVTNNRASGSRLVLVFIARSSSARKKANLDGRESSSAALTSWPASQKTANGNRSDSGTRWNL